MITDANQREYVIERPQATEPNWRYRPTREVHGETPGIPARGPVWKGPVMPRPLRPEVQCALVRTRENTSVAGFGDAVEVSAKRPMAVDRRE